MIPDSLFYSVSFAAVAGWTLMALWWKISHRWQALAISQDIQLQKDAETFKAYLGTWVTVKERNQS